MARLFSLVFLLSLALAAPAAAQEEVTETYRIPTVDGKEVSVEVRRIEGQKVPVILKLSPYNSLDDPPPVTDDALADKFVPLGYARAIGDVLGTRNSGGCWDYGGPKEIQAGVDMVNFLAKQPWSNGKVAMIGTSYDGTTANMIASRGAEAPGLAAVVPIAAISRWYGYAYTNGVRHAGNSQEPTDEGFDTPLGFDFGFGRTPPTDPGGVPVLADRVNPCDSAAHTQKAYARQPDYDAFWLERDYRKDAAKVRVPTLVAHGWQDYNVHQEEGLEMLKAVTGAPWRGMYFWQAPHASPEGRDDFATLLEQFFAKYLKGENIALPEAYFTEGRDSTGKVDIQKLPTWPPAMTGDVELKLGRGDDGGTLGGPGGGNASYRDSGTNTEESVAQDLGSEVQWLAYTSKALETDVRIAGDAVLDVTVAVSRANGHLVPTLFDIDEAGTPTPLSRGFMNLRYRDGLTKGLDMPVGKPTRVTFSFKPQDWTVRKGHRIGLSVQSSNTAWAVPDDPGLNVDVSEGRLLLPVVGAGKAIASGTVPGAVRPADTVPTAREAQRLSVRLKRLSKRRLRATGRAPKGARVEVRLLRGKKTVARRKQVAKRGTFTITFKVKRSGAYRAVASVRTREGLAKRTSKRARVR
jgi:X-Pro dipeptidyl-peptidase